MERELGLLGNGRIAESASPPDSVTGRFLERSRGLGSVSAGCRDDEKGRKGFWIVTTGETAERRRERPHWRGSIGNHGFRALHARKPTRRVWVRGKHARESFQALFRILLLTFSLRRAGRADREPEALWERCRVGRIPVPSLVKYRLLSLPSADGCGAPGGRRWALANRPLRTSGNARGVRLQSLLSRFPQGFLSGPDAPESRGAVSARPPEKGRAEGDLLHFLFSEGWNSSARPSGPHRNGQERCAGPRPPRSPGAARSRNVHFRATPAVAWIPGRYFSMTQAASARCVDSNARSFQGISSLENFRTSAASDPALRTPASCRAR